MDFKAYEEMALVQKKHWWFKARREILSRVISKLNPENDQNFKILEVGCGTGGNINMLQQHGNVSALEMNAFAREFTETNTGIEVVDGFLPERIPFEKNSFNLICLFDVLEHIEDDNTSLEVLQDYLKADGVLLITVPAYQWLFGKHDEILHHFRRYTLTNLKRILTATNYETLSQSYFNTFLFPIIALTRVVEILNRSQHAAGNQIPPSFLNTLLYHIFRSEKQFINWIKIPFGTSIIVTAKKIYTKAA